LKNRPFKVARILTRPGVGGATKHVALLSRGMAPEFETRLFLGPSRRGEGDYFKLFPDHSISKTRINPLRRDAAPWQDLRALHRLVRHFRAWRPDLVDTHLSKAGILGRLAAKICGIPSIHTFHINIFEGYDWPPAERQLYLRFEQLAARFSSRLICLSDDLGEQFLNAGIGTPEQFRSITLGIDLAPFLADPTSAKAGVRTELGLPLETPLVGLICRLAPVKNAKAFVEAAKLLETRLPDTHFVLVGDGESRPRLEALASQLHIKHRTHFLGIRSDIARLNLAFDCITLPSFQEGTPVSIIESLGAARPVIASDVGGVSRLIKHEETGLLLSNPSAKPLAEGIARVLGSPIESKTWGENGRALVQREWSLESMLARHREIYLEVLDKH
jgi:glycosyltransferase involved in cell wall biosynthesis